MEKLTQLHGVATGIGVLLFDVFVNFNYTFVAERLPAYTASLLSISL